MVSVDLPARAISLNMKQFNGKHACCYCEDPGVPRTTSHLQRDWPYSSSFIPRSAAMFREYVKHAVEEQEVVSLQCSMHSKMYLNYFIS